MAELRTSEQTLGYEFGWNRNQSLEISAGWQAHPTNSDSLFSGQWTTYYAIQTSKLTQWENGIAHVLSAETQFSGTGRPLPRLRPFEPVMTVPLRMSVRQKMQFGGKKTWLFLQAGPSATYHRFYKIETVENVDLQQEELSRKDFPIKTEELVRTTRFVQSRKMTLKSQWLLGCTVDAGWQWQPFRNIRLEGRMVTGLNTRLAYVEVPNPILKPMYLRFLVLVGVGF